MISLQQASFSSLPALSFIISPLTLIIRDRLVHSGAPQNHMQRGPASLLINDNLDRTLWERGPEEFRPHSHRRGLRGAPRSRYHINKGPQVDIYQHQIYIYMGDPSMIDSHDVQINHCVTRRLSRDQIVHQEFNT